MNKIGKWLDPEVKTDFWIQISNAISREDAYTKTLIKDIIQSTNVETMEEEDISSSNTFFNIPYSNEVITEKNLFEKNYLVEKAISFDGEGYTPSYSIVENREAYSIVIEDQTPNAETILGDFTLETTPEVFTFGGYFYSDEPTTITVGFKIKNGSTITTLSQDYAVDSSWTKVFFKTSDLYNTSYVVSPFIYTESSLSFRNVFLYRNSNLEDFLKYLSWEKEESKAIGFKNFQRNSPLYYTAVFKSVYETGQFGRYFLEEAVTRKYLVKDYFTLQEGIKKELDVETLPPTYAWEDLVWTHDSKNNFTNLSAEFIGSTLDAGDFLDDGSFVIDDSLVTSKSLNHLVLEYNILQCTDFKGYPVLLPFSYLGFAKINTSFCRAVTDQMHIGCQLNQAFDITSQAYTFNSTLRINRYNKIFSKNDIASINIGSLEGEVSQSIFDANYDGLTEFVTPAAPFRIEAPLAIIPLSGPEITEEAPWTNVLYEYIGGFRNVLSPLITGLPTSYTYDLYNATLGFSPKKNTVRAIFQVAGEKHTVVESIADTGIGYLELQNNSEAVLNLYTLRSSKTTIKISTEVSQLEVTVPLSYSPTAVSESFVVTYFVNGSPYTAYEQPDHSLLGEFLLPGSEVTYSGSTPLLAILNLGIVNLTIYTDVVVSFDYNSSQGIDNNTQIIYEYYDAVPKDITQVSLNAVDGSVLASCNFNPIELKTWDFHTSFGLALKG